MEQSPAQQGASDQQVAALIAAILAGTVVIGGETSLVVAIALVLETLTPPPVPSLAMEVAELVVEVANGPSVGSKANVGPREAGDGLDNLDFLTNNSGYSALYAVNSTRRIQQAMSEGESLTAAIAAESRHAEGHRIAIEQRDKGAELNISAARAFNTTRLNWNHLHTAKTHRPSHVNADGRNYDLSSPPRSTDGMLPAMAPHCDCVPAPEVPGAPMVR